MFRGQLSPSPTKEKATASSVHISSSATRKNKDDDDDLVPATHRDLHSLHRAYFQLSKQLDELKRELRQHPAPRTSNNIGTRKGKKEEDKMEKNAQRTSRQQSLEESLENRDNKREEASAADVSSWFRDSSMYDNSFFFSRENSMTAQQVDDEHWCLSKVVKMTSEEMQQMKESHAERRRRERDERRREQEELQKDYDDDYKVKVETKEEQGKGGRPLTNTEMEGDDRLATPNPHPDAAVRHVGDESVHHSVRACNTTQRPSSTDREKKEEDGEKGTFSPSARTTGVAEVEVPRDELDLKNAEEEICTLSSTSSSSCSSSSSPLDYSNDGTRGTAHRRTGHNDDEWCAKQLNYDDEDEIQQRQRKRGRERGQECSPNPVVARRHNRDGMSGQEREIDGVNNREDRNKDHAGNTTCSCSDAVQKCDFLEDRLAAIERKIEESRNSAHPDTSKGQGTSTAENYAKDENDGTTSPHHQDAKVKELEKELDAVKRQVAEMRDEVKRFFASEKQRKQRAEEAERQQQLYHQERIRESVLRWFEEHVFAQAQGNLVKLAEEEVEKKILAMEKQFLSPQIFEAKLQEAMENCGIEKLIQHRFEEAHELYKKRYLEWTTELTVDAKVEYQKFLNETTEAAKREITELLSSSLRENVNQLSNHTFRLMEKWNEREENVVGMLEKLCQDVERQVKAATPPPPRTSTDATKEQPQTNSQATPERSSPKKVSHTEKNETNTRNNHKDDSHTAETTREDVKKKRKGPLSSPPLRQTDTSTSENEKQCVSQGHDHKESPRKKDQNDPSPTTDEGKPFAHERKMQRPPPPPPPSNDTSTICDNTTTANNNNNSTSALSCEVTPIPKEPRNGAEIEIDEEEEEGNATQLSAVRMMSGEISRSGGTVDDKRKLKGDKEDTTRGSSHAGKNGREDEERKNQEMYAEGMGLASSKNTRSSPLSSPQMTSPQKNTLHGKSKEEEEKERENAAAHQRRVYFSPPSIAFIGGGKQNADSSIPSSTQIKAKDQSPSKLHSQHTAASSGFTLREHSAEHSRTSTTPAANVMLVDKAVAQAEMKLLHGSPLFQSYRPPPPPAEYDYQQDQSYGKSPKKNEEETDEQAGISSCKGRAAEAGSSNRTRCNGDAGAPPELVMMTVTRPPPAGTTTTITAAANTEPETACYVLTKRRISPPMNSSTENEQEEEVDSGKKSTTGQGMPVLSKWDKPKKAAGHRAPSSSAVSAGVTDDAARGPQQRVLSSPSPSRPLAVATGAPGQGAESYSYSPHYPHVPSQLHTGGGEGGTTPSSDVNISGGQHHPPATDSNEEREEKPREGYPRETPLRSSSAPQASTSDRVMGQQLEEERLVRMRQGEDPSAASTASFHVLFPADTQRTTMQQQNQKRPQQQLAVAGRARGNHVPQQARRASPPATTIQAFRARKKEGEQQQRRKTPPPYHSFTPVLVQQPDEYIEGDEEEGDGFFASGTPSQKVKMTTMKQEDFFPTRNYYNYRNQQLQQLQNLPKRQPPFDTGYSKSITPSLLTYADSKKISRERGGEAIATGPTFLSTPLPLGDGTGPAYVTRGPINAALPSSEHVLSTRGTSGSNAATGPRQHRNGGGFASRRTTDHVVAVGARRGASEEPGGNGGRGRTSQVLMNLVQSYEATKQLHNAAPR